MSEERENKKCLSDSGGPDSVVVDASLWLKQVISGRTFEGHFASSASSRNLGQR